MLPLGILIVVGAQMLEGGAPQSLLQARRGADRLRRHAGRRAGQLLAAGSACARSAAWSRRSVVDATTDKLAQRLVAIAGQAHRKGLMALETELNAIDDPFLAGGLALVIDGVAIESLRDITATERGRARRTRKRRRACSRRRPATRRRSAFSARCSASSR